MAWLDAAINASASHINEWLSGIKSKKQQKRAFDIQTQLNQQQAQLNYDYGEMAADNAHERTRQLAQEEREATSYVAKVQDAKEAGLSPSIFGGGAGGGGAGGSARGAQGDGSGGIQPVDAAAIMEAVNNKRAVSVEGMKARSEAWLAAARAAKERAEAKRIEKENKDYNEDRGIRNENVQASTQKMYEEINESLQRQREFDEQSTERLEELASRTQANKATAELNNSLKELNDKKTRYYYTELLNALRETNIKERGLENDRINALANQLAARAAYIQAQTAKEKNENPGDLGNVKTWKKLIDEFINDMEEDDNIIGRIVYGKKQGENIKRILEEWDKEDRIGKKGTLTK